MLIAYLRGGTTAVAQVLVGTAVTQGHLVFDQAEGTFQRGPGTGASTR